VSLAVTLLGSATFTTASGTKTVVATPAVGDLIVIVTAHSGNVADTTPTDDNSSGAYTRIDGALKAASVDKLNIFIRNTLIGAASSTTFTHAPGASTGGGMAVFKVTGMQKTGAAAAKRTAKQENQASGTPAPVFGAAPLTTNAVIGAVFNGANAATMTPRANFTELCDVGYNTPASGLETMSRDSGETATTQTWGSSSATAFSAIVLELDADKTLTPGLFTNSQTFPAPTVGATYALTPGLKGSEVTTPAPTVAAGAVNLTPGLKASEIVFSAPTVGRGAVGVLPGLLASAASFAAPTVGSTYALTPGLLTESQSFAAPAVAAGPVGLQPGLMGSAAAFSAPTVAPGAVGLLPSLVSTGNSFAAPTVAPGSVGLLPSLLGTANSFATATVAAGPVNLSPGLKATEASFAAPTVQPGAVALLPSLISNSQTFAAPAVTATYGIAPALASNAQSFFGPTVLAGAVNVAPPLFTEANSFAAAIVAPGPVGLEPSVVTNSPAFPAPTVSSTAALIASLFASTAVVSLPTILGLYDLVPAGFTNQNSFAAAAVAAGAANIDPPLMPSAATFWDATITGGEVAIRPALLAANDTFGFATVTPGLVGLVAPLVANGSTLYGTAVKSVAGRPLGSAPRSPSTSRCTSTPRRSARRSWTQRQSCWSGWWDRRPRSSRPRCRTARRSSWPSCSPTTRSSSRRSSPGWCSVAASSFPPRTG
jgi:hypothetical protein